MAHLEEVQCCSLQVERCGFLWEDSLYCMLQFTMAKGKVGNRPTASRVHSGGKARDTQDDVDYNNGNVEIEFI